jgi:hypothetical protein
MVVVLLSLQGFGKKDDARIGNVALLCFDVYLHGHGLFTSFFVVGLGFAFKEKHCLRCKQGGAAGCRLNFA